MTNLFTRLFSCVVFTFILGLFVLFSGTAQAGNRADRLDAYSTHHATVIDNWEDVALQIPAFAYGTHNPGTLAWNSYTVRGTIDVCSGHSDTLRMHVDRDKWEAWAAVQIDRYLGAMGHAELVSTGASPYGIELRIYKNNGCSREPRYSELRVIPGASNQDDGHQNQRQWREAFAAGETVPYPVPGQVTTTVVATTAVATPTAQQPAVQAVVVPVQESPATLSAKDIRACEEYAVARDRFEAELIDTIPRRLRRWEHSVACEEHLTPPVQ